MNSVYSDADLQRFVKVARGLSFDHGDEYGFSRHGSGLFLRYAENLFFICCKHSFHGGSVNGVKYEYYDSLCFLSDDGHQLYKPHWQRAVFSVTRDGDTMPSAEDLVIYEVDEEKTNPEIYRSMFESACILNPRELPCNMERNGNNIYIVGYPNIYGGNVNEEAQTVNDICVGRYGYVYSDEGTDIRCLMDVSGMTDDSSRIGEYGVDGMSGGAALTNDVSGNPLLVGMVTAGTVCSRQAVLMSAYYIAFVLHNWLNQKDAIQDSGEA